LAKGANIDAPGRLRTCGSENDQTDDGAGGDRRGLGVAPIASTAPSSNIWTFTMRNSTARKRQITQESSQTHEYRSAQAR